MKKQALLKQELCMAIDNQGEKIINIGESIMDSAELGYKETQTANRVKEIPFCRIFLSFNFINKRVVNKFRQISQ